MTGETRPGEELEMLKETGLIRTYGNKTGRLLDLDTMSKTLLALK